MKGSTLRVGAATVVALALSAVPASAVVQHDDIGPPSKDLRAGDLDPTAAQERAADDSTRWNRLGTPRVMTGTLATGLPADPEAAARAFLRSQRAAFGPAVDDLELLAVQPIGTGAAVILRQRFGGLRAGIDGLVSVAVDDGKVLYASSSLSRDTGATPTATVPAVQALRTAADDAGRPTGDLSREGRDGEWTEYDAQRMRAPVKVREVAVPTPSQGTRAAFEVLVNDETSSVQSFVDARTGEVLVRRNLVNALEQNATFRVFPNTPPIDYSSTDTRQLWCWTALAGCQRTLANPASPAQWDLDAATGQPTRKTLGNNTRVTEKWFSVVNAVHGTNFGPAPTRDFDFRWTNQWRESGCHPSSFFTGNRNDIDAARANLFAMHNRLHDWSYRLGFTERTWNLQQVNFLPGERAGDPEHGNAQSGGILGGPPTYASRNNAFQATPPDGQVPTTNMYLWQPIPAGFYSPCVDGDFDQSVIGHEYGHAISNRMVAGPDEDLDGLQADGMGESWSDLMSMEYLQEYGLAPVGNENPFSVGPYVTGNKQIGIRNYGMNSSPLNYSDVGYDLVGPQVHSDGEIWSATNFDLRSAFNALYDGAFPSSDKDLQARCADGAAPVTACPGNRRWMQLVFDAWPLMATGRVSMVDARDAMLVADQLRFGGAHQELMWNAFARRGLGLEALSNGATDSDPTPSFYSPLAPQGTVRFAPRNEAGEAVRAQLFVGQYEARATPVADSDPDTPLPSAVPFIPGDYELVARGPGYGHERLRLTVREGEQDLAPTLQRNHAAAAGGAVVSGPGLNLGKLNDETEATQWALLNAPPIRGKQVTVRLAGGPVAVGRVQVSALLRPRDVNDPGGDTFGQNRFSALRSFDILACEGACTQDGDFRTIFTSPDDAFPAVAPRPSSSHLIMRSFAVPSTRATHLRLRVRDTQCTGAPEFQGEQDKDPRTITDCDLGTVNGDDVRVAELQAFTR